MGFFKGLTSIVTSPISVVGKTVDKAINEDWEVKDVFTLGATKVVESVKETAEEIDYDFEE